MDKIKIWDLDYDGDSIWTFSDELKAIFRINIENGKTDLVKSFGYDEVGSYRGIKYCCGKIYLAPQNGTTDILIYDIEKNCIENVKINAEYLPGKEEQNLFIQIVKNETKLFFIPGRYEAIICLDLETQEISYISEWFDTIRKLLPKENSSLVIFNGVSDIDCDTLLLVGWKADVLVEFNMKSMSCKTISFKGTFVGFRGAAKINKQYWISYKGEVGLFATVNTEIEAESRFDKQGRLFIYKGDVYVASAKEASIYKINQYRSEMMTCLELGDEDVENPFLLVKQYGEKLILLYPKEDKFIVYDMETGEHKEVSAYSLNNYRIKILSDLNNGLFWEHEQLGLKDFVSLL